MFCEGVSIAGPYWNHVLRYWRASLESPERILFIKYENLKNETIYYVKKMAEFMGYPFFLEEEVNGVVQNVINLCSFEIYLVWRSIKVDLCSFYWAWWVKIMLFLGKVKLETGRIILHLKWRHDLIK